MAGVKQDILNLTTNNLNTNGNSNKNRHLDVALDEMKSGAKFIKVKSKSWKKSRLIELSQDHLSLLISKQTCGPRKSKFIDIKKIREIRVGHQSPIWEQLGANNPHQDRCFSLVLEDRTDPLNLVATDASSASKWIRGLRHLNSNIENLDVKGKHLVWVWEHFKKADKDSNGLLSFKEVKKLLNRLNFEASENYVETTLKEFDTSGDQCLSFEEFTAFFKKITWRPEIERLYKTYCDADLKLQANEICRFYRTEQNNNDVTIEMAKGMIEKYEPDEDCRRENIMTIYGFTYMLMSPHGDIFNIKHKKIVMNMNQPLSHYFIASSHNTYLTEDQLFGKSSVEAYIRAFERGCRCVELDCWDGDDGEPIIYHGYTLTSKIKFCDVIEVVREYAFKVSDYPVILSIENHCSVPQQTKMAKILKEMLGEKLLKSAVENDETKLPSPNSLKGKILVKGKRLPAESNSDGEVSNEDEAADIEDEVVKKDKKQKHIKLSRDLSDVVIYAISRHFKNFDDAKQRSDHRFISSLNEDKAASLAAKDPVSFVKHNSWQLSRIYPKGSRTNSSNYNPLQMWNSGCQIVALNYQTKDMETHLNESRFRSNGGCGYVLKPKCLLSENGFDFRKVDESSPHADPVSMEIRIITAQQLPKPPKNEKDVIDPYVVVSIMGCECDNQKQQTAAIENNGFNPAWINESPMKFKIIVPNLAFVEFKVMDKDSRGNDDLVGVYVLALDDVATGYRHVHLLTEGRQELSPATLFVHISICSDRAKL